MPTKIRKSRKLNEARVIALKEQGFSTGEIARAQGLDQSSVWRFLQANKPEILALKRFKEGRADALATLQARCLDVQTRIIMSLTNDVLLSLDAKVKANLLVALNVTSGTAFDKERLLLGLSTENHSVVRRLLEQQVKQLYAPVIQASGLVDTRELPAQAELIEQASGPMSLADPVPEGSESVNVPERGRHGGQIVERR